MPPVTIPLQGFITLTKSVNKIIQSNYFLTKYLFPETTHKTYQTVSVMLDVILGTRKLAPIIKRSKEAKIVGKRSSKSQSLTPPFIKIKKDLTSQDLLLDRSPDMPIILGGSDGADTIAMNRKKKIGEELSDMTDMIWRRIEWMVAQGLSGGFTIEEEDGDYVIDFLMPSENKPELLTTAKWDAPTTCKPISNMDAWVLQIQKKSGKIATDAIMTSTTFDKYKYADDTQNQLKDNKIKIGNIDTEESFVMMGAKKVARINSIDYWTYDEQYEDENGQAFNYIPDGEVKIVSRAADRRLHFGMIEDLKAGSVIGKFFSKDWTTEDPSVYWILNESHPLPAFHHPESMISAKVF